MVLVDTPCCDVNHDVGSLSSRSAWGYLQLRATLSERVYSALQYCWLYLCPDTLLRSPLAEWCQGVPKNSAGAPLLMIYEDKFIIVTEDGLTIKRYCFPLARVKMIPKGDVEQVRIGPASTQHIG